ncbi:hypothetical protein Slala03_54790 [Streptomyces lavendulae subsp. lavendulae]|nr:hypothetical protein Slala03_54790 [Streptomyces lavendulae subsp. lavendulae]
MATSVRKFVTATAASAVFAGGLLGISATPASAGEDCDDVYKRKYTEISSQWHKGRGSSTTAAAMPPCARASPRGAAPA